VYNDLYKAWKAEKTSRKTLPLPSDFYTKAAGYVKGLEDDSSAGDARTLPGRLLINEREMARRLLDEIRQARLHKIVNAARDGNEIDQNGLTDEEKKLVEHIYESLSTFEHKEKQEGSDLASEDKTELSILRFLDNVPEIVGVNLKIYGPYKKEDVGSLPKQNAQALIRQGLAKEVEAKRVQRDLREESTEPLHQQ
jgi:DNA replication initiation complex subunit (GINS family)